GGDGNRQRARAAEGAAAPGHRRAGEVDRRGAVERSPLHGQGAHAERRGAVERQDARGDGEVADTADVADGGGGAGAGGGAGHVVRAVDRVRPGGPLHRAGAADGRCGVEGSGVVVVEVQRGAGDNI